MKKTIVITGVTSGIGKALIEHFVAKKERVIGIARNLERIEALDEALKKIDKHHQTELIRCDLESFSDMQEALIKIDALCPKGIDVLINNAAIVPQARKITEDGFEMQYQVNHLSVAFMTEKLEPKLEKSQGVVITTSSDAHKRAKFDADDIHALKRYHAFRSYCRTKLYNIMYTLYKRKNGVKTIRYYAVHPGRVKTEIGTKDTSKLYALLWWFFVRSGYNPVDTVPTYDKLVYQNELEDAAYYHLEKPLDMSDIAQDEEAMNILYKATYNEIKRYL